MITLTQKELKTIRTVFYQTLDLRRHARSVVGFHTGKDGLRIRVVTPDGAAEYHRSGSYSECSFHVAFDIIASCAGNKDNPVTITVEDDSVLAQWLDGQVPQSVRFPVSLPKGVFPELPKRFSENPPALLDDLAAACGSIDRYPARPSLACLFLRGAKQQLVATDGKEIFVANGLRLPCKRDILVRAGKVFLCKHLPKDKPVRVGATDEKCVVKVEPWTFCLPVEKDSRYPDVDNILRDQEQAQTTLNLEREDSRFLAENLDKLPVSDESYRPVTLDMNGAVAVRASAAAKDSTTELILSRSSYQGGPLKVSVDRRLLHKALNLGFERMNFFADNRPILCRSDTRTFGFMPLGGAPHETSEQATRIESAPGPEKAPARATSKRRARKPGNKETVPVASSEPVADVPSAVEQEIRDLEKTIKDSQTRIEELTKRQTPPSEETVPAPPVPEETPAEPATERQLALIQVLARQVRGIGERRIGNISEQLFAKPLEALTSQEAESMAERLRAVRSGRMSLEELTAGTAV